MWWETHTLDFILAFKLEMSDGERQVPLVIGAGDNFEGGDK